MSKVEIDGVAYECPPEVAGLLQAVSEERDELQAAMTASGMEEFKEGLTHLINRHGIENVADMPDFLLAGMICRMIEAMGPSIKKTLGWHGCDSVCHPSPNTAAEGQARRQASDALHERRRGGGMSEAAPLVIVKTNA